MGDKDSLEKFDKWMTAHRMKKKQENIDQLIDRFKKLRKVYFYTDDLNSDGLHDIKSANHLTEMSVLNLNILM